ncbi:MAG: thiamine-phosphate kinase [Alphaproteobacteria bacterium]|nr:thiamine-phosphate kinase [Alphaproteobacteria bacterium]
MAEPTSRASGLGEFGRIATFFAPLTEGEPGARRLTDDAAVLRVEPDRDLVITTDTLVEAVHYRGPEAPGAIARKLLRVSLSDLAAKGAAPRAYTLNLALPTETDDAWVEAFARGLAEDQSLYGVTLIGGDSVSTPGPAVLTATFIGSAPKGGALRRSGAREGDHVWVTGTIGDGAFGLDCARGDFPDLPYAAREALIGAYETPEPPVGYGAALIGLARAATDISDGLVADLGHVCRVSGLCATLETTTIPLSDPVAGLIADQPDQMIQAITGGDDYQILFAAPADAAGEVIRRAERADVRVTRIGVMGPSISASEDPVSVLDSEGQRLAIGAPGYQHR